MRNYPKNSIAALIVVFFLNVIHFDVVLILNYYIEISDVYSYLLGMINFMICYSVYLTLTGIFYFLADFAFEQRENQDK